MEVGNFYGHRKVTKVTTILEALDTAGSSDKVVKLVVLPPAAGDSSDQDSDIEDICDDPEEQHEPAGHIEVEEEIDVEEEIETDNDGNKGPVAKKQRRELPKWKKNCVFDKTLPSADILLPDHLLQLDDASPYEILRQVFTDEMVSYITEQTKLYANRDHNNPNFDISEKEVRNFMGILLLSGYHTLPKQPDLGVPLVSNTMSKNRFCEIKKFIHFADNQHLEQGNKMSKISPIYDMLNDRFVQFGVFHQLLSVDESMVPYYGRHSAQMFIRGKPIRFGYKIWCLCGNDGFPYPLKLYQGKEEGRIQPLGMSVITKMVDVISSHSNVEIHQLYFDNFFTSYDLLVQLAETDAKATGTLRDNRSAGAAKALVTTKALQKMERAHSIIAVMAKYMLQNGMTML
ncbi:piggyBac transposable element-derived protein 2-like [Macrobrachium rosenbergii]|uniref:piggyBac transposable element-derived protein 2-like n=1 Tax=Macrobrachium rosenbergii TaxID=79674 RepID=UPI0034D4E898